MQCSRVHKAWNKATYKPRRSATEVTSSSVLWFPPWRSKICPSPFIAPRTEPRTCRIAGSSKWYGIKLKRNMSCWKAIQPYAVVFRTIQEPCNQYALNYRDASSSCLDFHLPATQVFMVFAFSSRPCHVLTCSKLVIYTLASTSSSDRNAKTVRIPFSTCVDHQGKASQQTLTEQEHTSIKRMQYEAAYRCQAFQSKIFRREFHRRYLQYRRNSCNDGFCTAWFTSLN